MLMLLFLFFISEHASPLGKWVELKKMWLVFVWLLKCICVTFKSVGLWYSDKYEQILTWNLTQEWRSYGEVDCALNVYKYSGGRLAPYLIYVCNVCVCVCACLSFFAIDPFCLSLWSISFLSKNTEKALVPPLRLWSTSWIDSSPFMSLLNTPLPSPFINTDSWKKKQTKKKTLG